MITKSEYEKRKKDTYDLIIKSGLVMKWEELENIDIADFGLSNIDVEGAQIVSLFETGRVAARVIVLFPWQTEPEHWHTGYNGYIGKEETLRVISGDLLVFIEGSNTMNKGKIPKGKEKYYNARNEILLKPTEKITFNPEEKHWFQAMDKPVVFYTMSTLALDDKDPFSDPNVVRKTKIV